MKRLVVLAAVATLVASAVHAQTRPIAPDALRSGIDFAGRDVRAMQSDDGSNPAMLWVERGKQLFEQAAENGAASCGSCHAGDTLRGIATRYPAYDAGAKRVIDLEDRINACRTRFQRMPFFARGSDDLLALTAFLANASRGMPVHVSIAGGARPAFERAARFYRARRGQMNLSCSNCHDANYDRRLLGETISQGHGTAFPAYRLEWQTLGSLQRRLRACLFGIRARVPPEGTQALTELELYLAWRADGLPIEAPGVRR